MFIHFRPNHKRTYVQYSETDPLVIEGRQLVNDLTFWPPEVAPLSGVAGRVYVLKSILGHKSIAMTQRYAHLSPGYRKAMVERMEQIWIKPLKRA